MAYREHSTRVRPNEVVTHRPIPIAGALGFLAMVLTLATVVGALALRALKSISISCDRGATNVCIVRHHYGPFATEHPIAMARIHAIHLRALPGKKYTTYVTSLITKDGEMIDLLRTSYEPDAAAIRKAVEDLALTPGVGVGRVNTQSGSPEDALAGALFATFALSLSLLFFRSARLEFDFDQRTLSYTRYRWPLPPARRWFYAGDVKSALVNRVGNKALYEVELQVRGEENLRLVPMSGTDHHSHVQTANRINALLRDLRDETGT